PPMVVSIGDKDRPVSLDQVTGWKQQLLQLTSGQHAGEPLVMNFPAEVKTLNYDYSRLGLRDVRAIPEERFCAAMGISPYSLHFGPGSQRSTFSNVEQYLKQDYRAYIVPFHQYIAKRIQRELLPEFGPVGNLKVRFDYDETPLMQPDQNQIWDRVGNAFKN